MTKKKTGLANATTSIPDPDTWVIQPSETSSSNVQEKSARLVVEIPSELHRQLKGKCGMEGLKIKQVIEQLLRNWVEQQ